MQKYLSKRYSEILRNIIGVVILLITLKAAASQEIIINEIMYNPIGDDNNKEFVELLLIEPISLQNYIIADSSSNDTLTTIKYNAESIYAVIVEEGFNITIINTTNASFYSAGATIGNNLNNDQDTITIYNTTGAILATFTYNNSIANNNDFSIERNTTGYFESSVKGGTLGTKNSIEHTIAEEIETNEDNSNDDNEENSDEQIINQSINNEQVNETEEEIPITTNATEEITNATLSLKINLPETIYTQIPYENIFSIKNNKYKRGSNQTINITLTYNITKDNTAITNNITITNNTLILTNIKASKSTETGEFTLTEEGSFTLCGTAATNDEPTNTCKTFTAISAKNVSCDLAISIRTEKIIYNSNEKITFYPEIKNNEQNFPITIAYQIKDLFNNTLQKQKETTNSNKKSYTPEITQSVDVINIQTELKNIPCNDNNESNNYAEQLIIIKNSLLEENTITIEKLPEQDIFFGDTIKPRINIISKNKTTASIKVYIENKEEKRLTQTYYLKPESLGILDITIPMTIDENCEGKWQEGTYYLVAEGFNKKEQKQLVIKKEEQPCSKEPGASSYEITDFQETIQPQQSFITDISITNDDDTEHNYTLWSYVYRGPKSYSGDRLQNLQKITISPEKNKIIGLKNVIENIAEGEYNLKVLIQKDEQKTTASITRKIVVAADGKTKTKNKEEREEAITSFYTKAKKLTTEEIGTKINLFSTITGEGNYTLLLETSREKKTIPLQVTEKNKTMITTEIVPGKNIYVLKLLKGTNVVDTKDLILYTNDRNIVMNEQETTNTSNQITGYTVSNQPIYQSTAAKVKELIIPLSIVVLVTLVWITTRELKGKLFKQS